MAYNQSDQYFEPSTDTDANFGNSVAGQTNSYFLPAVYSKKVLNFFRKSSVAEAITNTDYAGEITAYGDTVRIIKEPVITVYQYERGQDVTQTKLTDQKSTSLSIRRTHSSSSLTISKLLCLMSTLRKLHLLQPLTHCVMLLMRV